MTRNEVPVTLGAHKIENFVCAKLSGTESHSGVLPLLASATQKQVLRVAEGLTFTLQVKVRVIGNFRFAKVSPFRQLLLLRRSKKGVTGTASFSFAGVYALYAVLHPRSEHPNFR